MNQPIHDDEPDTSAAVVASLLAAECPQWGDAAMTYLETSGTDNAMWRLHLADELDVVVRLPRRPGAAANVGHELAVLDRVGQAGLTVETPTVLHAGEPHAVFAHRWSVLQWIEGRDAWSARHDPAAAQSPFDLARALAQAVTSLGAITEIDVPTRQAGQRGGPIGPLIDQIHRWLDSPAAANRIDVAAVKRLTDQALEVAEESITPRFVHGDLIPGNVLLDEGRLSAIIDWGGAGWGDPAQDLAPAWAILGPSERPAFQEMTGADEAAWIRGRTFELEHAIGGVLYYEPRGHVLGDIMARTLDQILNDA